MHKAILNLYICNDAKREFMYSPYIPYMPGLLGCQYVDHDSGQENITTLSVGRMDDIDLYQLSM